MALMTDTTKKLGRAVKQALGASPTVAEIQADIAAYEANLQALQAKAEEREQAYTLAPDERLLDEITRLHKQIELEGRRRTNVYDKLIPARVNEAYEAYDALIAQRAAATGRRDTLIAQINALNAQLEPLLREYDAVKLDVRSLEHRTVHFPATQPQDIRPLVQPVRLKEIEVKHGFATQTELENMRRHEAEIAAEMERRAREEAVNDGHSASLDSSEKAARYARQDESDKGIAEAIIPDWMQELVQKGISSGNHA